MSIIMNDRIVALVDMDCFYCQVEARLNPDLKGKPMAVVQYNAWKGGGIIAVNYEARDRGVTRHMRGDEAKQHCPEIELVSVPSIRGKADLTKYRDAGREVVAVLCKFSECVQRASVDEAYIDLTEAVKKRLDNDKDIQECQLKNSFIVGYSDMDNNDEGTVKYGITVQDYCFCRSDGYAIDITPWQQRMVFIIYLFKLELVKESYNCLKGPITQKPMFEGIQIDEERLSGVETWLDEIYNGDLRDPQLHKLATAAVLVEEMRLAVYETTGFRCSAGIAHNKILAKLVCGLHKPNRQTVLPKSSVPELYQTLPVKKVRNLGGKLGDDVVDRLGISVMADLAKFSERELQSRYDEKTGTWLYNIARGIDLEPVTPRLVTKSIGCCKKFPGRSALSTKKDVNHWLAELAGEVAERLEEDFSMNKRRAQLLTISFQQDVCGRTTPMSRSGPFSSYEPDKIVTAALSLLQKTNTAPSSSGNWTPPIKFLGISAGKFTETGGSFSTVSLDNFFRPSVDTLSSSMKKEDKDVLESSVISKETPKPINITENKSEIKNTSGSFFEKYLRNKSTKLPENEIAKRNCMYFEQSNKIDCQQNPFNLNKELSNIDKVEKQTESYKTELFIGDLNKNIDFFSHDSIKGNDKFAESIGEKASTSYSNLSKSDLSDGSKMDYSPLPVENNENLDMWVSPSEIFPDMSKIDDNVMQLLPSPLQRKIVSARKNQMSDSENSNDSSKEKTISDLSGNNNNEPHGNRFSLSSTSSECAPTILETVACVHSNDIQQFKTTNPKFNFGNQCKPTTSLDTSSIDIFAEEEEEPETSYVSEECPHCKEKILLQDFPEHLDHHLAMDLHKQLNSLQPQNNPDSRNNAASNKKKRGRPNKKEAPIPHKKTRTIASFFSRR